MIRLSDLELTPRFRLLFTALTVVLTLVVTTFSLVYFFLAIQATAVKNLNRGGRVIRVLLEERRKDLGEFARGLADNKTLQLLLDMDMPQKVGELTAEALVQKQYHLVTVYNAGLEVQADVGWEGSGVTGGRKGPTSEERTLLETAAAHDGLNSVILITQTSGARQPVLSSVVTVRRGNRTVGYLAAHYLVMEDRDFFRTLNAILAAEVAFRPSYTPPLLPGVHGLHVPRPLELIRFDLLQNGLIHFQTVSDYRDHVVALLELHADGREIRDTFVAALSFYFLFALGMMVAVMLLVTRMTGLILNPVGRLLDGVRKITAGDLTYEIPVTGRDEIAQLGHSFNEMRRSLDSKIQEIQRLNDLKDQFLANTSHELRTPLVGMTGLLESVLEDPQSLSSENVRKLNLVYSSSQRLTRLINDILDLSRLRKQELPINWTSVDLQGLCRKVIGLFAKLSEGKTLELEAPASPVPPVWADEARLEQVLINLVGNAVKFTPEGWIRLRLIPSGAMVTMEVADSGIGIPEDRQQAVFESFSQASPEISRDYGGTGLGLTISRELLKAMDSGLKLVSSPGRGSTFSFSLKSAAPVEAVSRVPSDIPGERPEGHELQGRRVVAVDDEPINLEVLKVQLRNTGVGLEVFTTGDAALKALAEKPADLIIMDVMMPGKSGFELVQEMRALGRKEPVLFLTARNHTQDLKLLLEVGGTDIRSKPLGRGDLIERIKLLGQAFPLGTPVPQFLDPGTVHLLSLEELPRFPVTRGIPLVFLDAWWALWWPEGELWPQDIKASECSLHISEPRRTQETLMALWEQCWDSLTSHS